APGVSAADGRRGYHGRARAEQGHGGLCLGSAGAQPRRGPGEDLDGRPGLQDQAARRCVGQVHEAERQRG
ncbi:unnamed protein product, partial [Ectocarpus sp. 12 AP-2014]